VRNRVPLVARIEQITVTRPRAHWLEAFTNAGIPCGPINNYAETFADPQILSREMLVQVDHPALGTLKMPGSPIKMSETPTSTRRRAPMLGEHTREVLLEAGFSDEEIRALAINE
jgi:crotonobetainyl-CoA:carnitine CoA-transferase CaiB-like acyl-CoA transferase